jgi:UDPglucose--hexose-1-phosphate uridylyltransferase
MAGIGAHEVVIETADHTKSISTMAEPEIECVLWAFRDRLLQLRRDPRLRFVLIFKNHGAAAGATLEHAHSQIIGLPIVPDFVRDEVDGAKRHFDVTGRCVFCTVTQQELAAEKRVVDEHADVVALAPYAARFPFETWILPRRHLGRYEESPAEVYGGLAAMLKSVLLRMDRALWSPAYNLILHTSPILEDTGKFFHWHIEVIPRLTRTAGFEWGAGFTINPTAPEEAAHILRHVEI